MTSAPSAPAAPRTRWRRLLLVLAVLLALLLLAGAWIAWTARTAQAELRSAAAALPAARTAWADGDPAAGRRALAAANQHTQAAYDATHDPVWAVVGALPLLGQPVHTTAGLAAAVRELTATTLPTLTSQAAASDPAALMAGPGRVDVAALAALAPTLSQAATQLRSQEQAVLDLPASWLPPVAEARTELLAQVQPLADNVTAAADAARWLPDLLGRSQTRRYLVMFQNPAEARGTGGLLDAFLVLRASNGALTVERSGPREALPPLTGNATLPGVDEATAARYRAAGALDLWVNTNLSADLPEVARFWAATWQAGTNQRLDGVITTDPQALAAVVAATGPVQAPGIGPVDAERVVDLVLREQYTLFPFDPAEGTGDRESTAVRKDAMLSVGTAAIEKVLNGTVNETALVQGLVRAARERHAQVYSARADEQAAILQAGLAGAVPTTAGPFAQPVIINAAGSKLDAYLRTDVAYRTTTCSADEQDSAITVTLRNTAPSRGLPPYVTFWAAPGRERVGENRNTVQVLLGTEARVLSATLDGDPVLTAPEAGKLPPTLPGVDDPSAGPVTDPAGVLTQGSSAGRPFAALDVSLLPGQTRHLTLTVREPRSANTPVLVPPLLATPATTSAGPSGCR